MEDSRRDSSPTVGDEFEGTLVSDIYVKFPLDDIVHHALANLNHFRPTTPIFVDAHNPKDYISAGEVVVKIQQLVAGLQSFGLKEGQCVCIHSYNCIWYPLLWLAVIAAGGVVTGSNPGYSQAELSHHLKITHSQFIITHVGGLDAVRNVVTECGILKSNVFILGGETLSPDKINGFNLWTALLEHGTVYFDTFTGYEAQKGIIAAYACTSGTTGLPKAAEISHRYLVTQARIVEYVFSQRMDEVRQLISLPIFHAFASQLAIVLPLRMGITTYLMPRFHWSNFVQNVVKFQITDIPIVPPILSALLRVPGNELESLRYIICAGAPMDKKVQAKLHDHLHPAATISQCWGMTELGWVSLFEQTENDYEGSVGRLLPNVLLKIVDDNGQVITEQNTPGEAYIKSETMFNGYRDNPVANAKAFDDDGYYRTGDRVYMSRGKIFLVGRIKEIMKVKGWQVSPQELEDVVRQLDEVVDCAVVEHVIEDSNGLEEICPRAFVVVAPNANITSLDIQTRVAEQVVAYKRLTGGVVFTDAIPRNSTGKILRYRLLDTKVAVNRCGNLYAVGTKEAYIPGKSFGQQGLVQKVLEEETGEMWSYYLVAMVLMPVCFVLGIPGLVLMVVALRRHVGRL